MGTAKQPTRKFCVLNANIICFSGKIGSGKSSVSFALAERLGCKRASFGSYVRYMVEKRGKDPTSRQSLQDYGQARVQLDIVQFCRDVLAHVSYMPPEQIVIDGVRHVDVLEVLIDLLSPARVSLIHLELDDESRHFRISDRGDDRDDIERAEQHVVEADLLDNLPRRADLILKASQPLDTVVQQCLDFVNP